MKRSLLVACAMTAACSGSPPSSSPCEGCGAPDATVDASVDAREGGDDAASDAIFPTEDAPPLPPMLDLSLGPYASALDILLRSLRVQAKALDSNKSYSQSAAQGYVVQAIAHLLHAARGRALPGGEATREELLSIAIGELDELAAASKKCADGAPGFGLSTAWDAFGDGSENPPYTCYAWQTGMVAVGAAELLRYLDVSGARAADRARVRDFLAAIVAPYAKRWTSVSEGGATLGYYWYSAATADAKAVHNTSALIATAVELLADATAIKDEKPSRYAALLKRRLRTTAEGGYAWNYVDDGWPVDARRPEDVSHAALTLQFLRFGSDRGWFTSADMSRVATTLAAHIWSGNPARARGAVDGSSGGESEWDWTAVTPISFAAHADAPGGRAELFDFARSLLVSSYLTAHDRPIEGATVDAVRTLALALLFRHRPNAYAPDSKWSRVAGPGDDALPTAPGGVRFYTIDWAAPAPVPAETLTLVARRATATNANLLVDLDPGETRRIAVSITYRADASGTVGQWDGSAYVPLAPITATRRRDGKVVWMRTTFLLDPKKYADYQPSVPGKNVLLQIGPVASVHRIEATPID